MKSSALLVALFLAAACAKPPTLTVTNTSSPGPHRVEGDLVFPATLPAGSRVQVAFSARGKGTPSTSSFGMGSLDLAAPAQKLHFVITGLAEGKVTLKAGAFSAAAMKAMADALAAADVEFKKTGRPTMAPNPDPDFAGVYTGGAPANGEDDAKALELAPGSTSDHLELGLVAIDKSAPAAFSGHLTVGAVLAMRDRAKPFADWEPTLSAFKSSLGEPTASQKDHVAWGVVEGETCAYVSFDRDDRSKFFKNMSGDMVGASMPATKTTAQDETCRKAAGLP